MNLEKELKDIDPTLVNMFRDWYDSGDKPEDLLLGIPPHFRKAYTAYYKLREKNNGSRF